MNRFKKELRKKDVQLEQDYPYLPYDEGGVTLESVIPKAELGAVTYVYTSIIITNYYDRNMQVYKQLVD